MSIVVCQTCACGCIPVDLPCLRQHTRITDLSFQNHAHLFDKVNAFVARTVLGEVCFNLLCQAVVNASDAASEANNAADWKSYMAEPWKTIVSNHHFIRLYYLALLAEYDLSGMSATQLTTDGRTRHNRPLQEGGKENVTMREAQYMAHHNGVQLNHAVVNFRSWVLRPLYSAGRIDCYSYCGNANLLCGEDGGKFWHR